jgi:Family of unknown function (DUF6282)
MTPSVPARSLAGVIDIHCHCGPDSLARTIDAVDLARLAKERGMRGIVIKNHYEPTASVAYLARKAVPGIEVFGGVTLNLASGGMNPYAVEHLAKVSGGAGRFVWMGSLDTEAQVRYSKDDRPFVAVARDGELLPEVIAVIAAIARHDLVLETGHSTPEEVLLLVREARSRGVRHIVVTHAMIAPIHFQVAHMQEAVELGAFIEFVYNGLIGPFKEFEFADYARAIQAVGVQHCILSSDLGQPVNAVHPDGLAAFFDGLEREGFTPDEIDQMSKVNPARILGLE